MLEAPQIDVVFMLDHPHLSIAYGSMSYNVFGCLAEIPGDFGWPGRNPSLSVNSARGLIDAVILGDEASATRWVKLVPIKVNVLCWKMAVNGLPTRHNMSKRGIEMDSIKCAICEDKLEDIDHLFFGYDFAKEVIAKLCTWGNIGAPMVSSMETWVTWFDGLRMEKKIKEVFQGLELLLASKNISIPLRINDVIIRDLGVELKDGIEAGGHVGAGKILPTQLPIPLAVGMGALVKLLSSLPEAAAPLPS
ncbi:hypothetical protein LXL04_010249 [Taraxacum kok-saghyz]